MPRTSNDDVDKKKSTSVRKSLVIGGVAAFFEMLINHPLWVLKTRSQCKYPFTLNPFILYKGFTYHAVGEIALSSIQISAAINLSEELNHIVSNDSVLQKWNSQIPLGTLISSLVCGGLTGMLSTPFDVVMVQQQKNVKFANKDITNDFLKITNKIIDKYGYKRLFCGLPATSMKVALFNSGIFIGTPYIGKNIDQYACNHAFSSFTAGVIAGGISALVTQPFDIIKTLQQDEICNPLRLHAFERAKKLYAEEGYIGFFTGLRWRGAQVIAATAAAGTVMEISRPTF